MTNLQLVEALCRIIEEESRLLSVLYSRLSELDGVTEADLAQITALEAEYNAVMGS
jgi:hypothetical protein